MFNKKSAADKPRKKKKLPAIIIAVIVLVIVWAGTTQTGETPAAEPSPSAAPEIDLVAGQAGDYGELLTLNEGTDTEETYYVYRVPAGTYTVTNAGKYMSQFNVCGDTVYKTDAGWDELSDVIYVKLLDVGQSDTVEIGDGQIIEIHEPDHFKLVKVS